MAPPFVHDDLESRISRRARIITVTVFVADFAVLAVNHKLAFLVFGDIFCVVDSFSLSIEILCRSCCFFSFNLPIISAWHNVLISYSNHSFLYWDIV